VVISGFRGLRILLAVHDASDDSITRVVVMAESVVFTDYRGRDWTEKDLNGALKLLERAAKIDEQISWYR
jgi:hypothetical protein